MRLFAFLWIASGVAAAQPFDLIISGAKVVDGTGSPWFHADVAVRGDRIARIAPAGLLRAAEAQRRIEARGLVLAPGFIDIQGHSREFLLDGDGTVIAKVSQGVTTEILGEGTTNAPANEKTSAQQPGSAMARGAKVRFAGDHGFDEWLRAMEKHGASINFGSFIGAGTLRQYVKGMAQGRLSSAEQQEMRRVVDLAMRDGAFGIASALIYPPDSYQSTEELIEAAKAMAPYGGVYITHMRSEADMILDALKEALEIGAKAGVPVEIYHLKAGGKRNWNRMDAVIERINAARAAGQDVQANMYPYTAGATGLTSCLPPWAAADGKLFANLADPAVREKIRAEALDENQTAWENLCHLSTYEGVLVLGLRRPENKAYAGKRLSEIAAAMQKHPIDAAIDLILGERQRVGTVYFMMSEENVRRQLQLPWIKIGTDAGGPNPATDTLVHPRSYGTYPRILGKYVREEKVLTLEDAIRKMTSAVATRLHLYDRGVIREGLYADLVLLNAETVIDKATFERPNQVSAGVEHVFVNGVEVWSRGRHTGGKPGRIVRGPGYRPY
jgi:dihydroorotase/N-acyl-D-amino-acid deacylase